MKQLEVFVSSGLDGISIMQEILEQVIRDTKCPHGQQEID